jgi:hypothetical protein
MLRGFMQRSDLWRWLSRPDSDPLLRQSQELIDRLYGGAKKDDDVHLQEVTQACAEASSDGEITSVPRDFPSKSKVINMRARFRSNQVIYARSSTHMGNSLISYYTGGDRSRSAVPGSIEHIFEEQGTVRFAVRRYREYRGQDPFAQWPDFPAKMWSLNQQDQLEAVEVSWVVCHFAQYRLAKDFALGKDLQVVLVLDQVRLAVVKVSFYELTHSQYL